MGRVRTKTVKRSAKAIVERHYPTLTLDFSINKRRCDQVALIPSKRLRNKIAGYVTHLMRRIQDGPVRGISFKLQEDERERKDQIEPEVSAIDRQKNEFLQIEIDQETKDMIRSMGFDSIPANVVPVVQSQARLDRPGGHRSGDRRPAH